MAQDTQSTEKAVESAVAQALDTSLDEIREILIGEQSRELERRLAISEARTQEALRALQDETRTRLDRIESFARQEIERLSLQDRSELTERQHDLKRLADDGERQARELRMHVLDTANRLADQFHQEMQRNQRSLSSVCDDLREMKIDRDQLGAFLLELGGRISRLPRTKEKAGLKKTG